MKQQILIPTADAGKMRNMYQIGETYGSAELIGSYLGSGLLDAQFDFNMYDAAVNAFKGNRGMNQLANTLTDSRNWYGSHHLMGNISGNQDKPRIMSLLDGSLKEGENTKQVGWDREIQINDSLGYARLLNMMAFNMIIPGVPVIYYGDEIGMPGANDPDSRRLMRFDKGLQSSAQAINKKELYLRNQISSLTNLRNNNMALLYGNMVSTSIGDSVLVIDRTYLNQNVIGIINNGNSDVYVVIKKRKGEST
jgi:glycosidase